METRLFIQVGIALTGGRLIRLMVGALFLSVLLPPAVGYAQPTPPAQSLCDMPSSTRGWSKYCGGGTAAPAAPAGPTPQQQMGSALGQAALPYVQQMVHNFFYNTPTKQVQDPAQQERALAAHQLNNSGIYLLRKGNYAGAINEFQLALAKTPNDPAIIHNLALAREQQLNVSRARQTSGALGQLLGTAPANTGFPSLDQLTHSSVANPNASALSLVNLSDTSVVDLRGTTSTSVDPESLKSQLDGVLTNRAPASAPPDPRLQLPQSQDIELLFDQPPQATSSQWPGPQRPANNYKLVNPIDAEQETKARAEAAFAQPGGLDDILDQKFLENVLPGIKPTPAPAVPARTAKPAPVLPHN
jgi:hypothetical protein